MPKSLFIYKDDAQLVADLLAGNEGALHYVFYDHFNPLLKMNAYKAAGTKQVEYDDLVQELYLYLRREFGITLLITLSEKKKVIIRNFVSLQLKTKILKRNEPYDYR